MVRKQLACCRRRCNRRSLRNGPAFCHLAGPFRGVRDAAPCQFVALDGDAVLLLGPPGSGSPIWCCACCRAGAWSPTTRSRSGRRPAACAPRCRPPPCAACWRCAASAFRRPAGRRARRRLRLVAWLLPAPRCRACPNPPAWSPRGRRPAPRSRCTPSSLRAGQAGAGARRRARPRAGSRRRDAFVRMSHAAPRRARWCWSPACRAPARRPSSACWRTSATRRWTTRRCTILEELVGGRRGAARGRHRHPHPRLRRRGGCSTSWRGCAPGRTSPPRWSSPPPRRRCCCAATPRRGGATRWRPAGRSAAGWRTASPGSRPAGPAARGRRPGGGHLRPAAAGAAPADRAPLPAGRARRACRSWCSPSPIPGACRARPTWSSTCASCATRTTTRRCGR